MVVDKFGGNIPTTREELLSLPGIGPYCSASILSFAYNLPAPVVDTNIRRVLISELDLDENLSSKELEQVAEQCIPAGKSNDRHNALMDYGSSVATAAKTGIRPLSQQSPFAGSVREARGMIIRYLLAEKQLAQKEIRKKILHPRAEEALTSLLEEKMVVCEKGVVSLI
ncbi:MAG: hypothetical protein H6765_02600 [Candidatus Peribacteria bacterium]|nr:MAG: hypothetical protein H6765_02600 [Candidatus Peribacteria bacterium]